MPNWIVRGEFDCAEITPNWPDDSIIDSRSMERARRTQTWAMGGRTYSGGPGGAPTQVKQRVMPPFKTCP